MLPRLRQRFLILVSVVVGAAGLWLVKGVLRGADGSAGLSMIAAAAPWWVCLLAVIAGGLPALACGTLASASGNPLSGIFVVAASLTVIAAAGGPIDGVFRRSALPELFPGLIFECALWMMVFAVMFVVIGRLRRPTRARFPALADPDHLGVDLHVHWPQLQALGAGAVCVLIGGALAWFLLRSADPGQVICSLIIAFTIGALVGQLTFPHNNAIGLLLAPAVVGVIGYLYSAMQFRTETAVLLAWFNLDLSLEGRGRLPGIALALPIHYLSAGLMGVTLGIGWAQTLTAPAPAVGASANPSAAQRPSHAS